MMLWEIASRLGFGSVYDMEAHLPKDVIEHWLAHGLLQGWAKPPPPKDGLTHKEELMLWQTET